MTREELKEYAAANRSRLEKQKVELGDLVMILVGRFAGENGVVKGISVCGNDFTDPYYVVDMACEVPDKYKCRKTLIQPNNVIGGLSASDFEVIANRATEEEPKLPKYPIGTKVHTIYGDGVVDKTIEGDIAVRLYGGGLCGIGSISGVQCGNDDAWQSYRMELAAKIAVAYAEKGRYEPSEIGAKAVEVANGVFDGLINTKI